MKMTFRWYGSQMDPIPLRYIKQIPNMSGVVTSLMDMPAGALWPEERIQALKQEINDAGLEMEVIESVNIQEGITCTFYTNEGRLYEKLKGYYLRDISWDMIGSESNTVDDLMNVFNDQINGVKEEDEKYLLCSAGTSKDFFISKDNPSQLNFYMLLNELEYDGNVPKLVGRKERVYYDDDTDSATEITIPKGVTSISNYAFFECLELKNITIPSNVFDIGEGCFSDSSIQNIDFENNSRLLNLGEYAFCNCIELKYINLCENVENIGECCFKKSSIEYICTSNNANYRFENGLLIDKKK